MRSWIQASVLASVIGFVLLIGAPAQAQRTGDHIVPSIETVCDGDPFSFGLCNSYCEALDCESPTPLGTPRACSNLLRNYKKKSGGRIPPCGCPCGFNVQADLTELLIAGEEEFNFAVDGPFNDFCDTPTFNGMLPTYVGEQFNDPSDGNTEQGVRLLYWIDGDTCHEQGGLLDDVFTSVGDFDYEPIVFDRVEDNLTAGEVGACQSLLNFLCPE